MVVSEERLFAQNLCDSGVSTTVLIEDGGAGHEFYYRFGFVLRQSLEKIENVAEVTHSGCAAFNPSPLYTFCPP